MSDERSNAPALDWPGVFRGEVFYMKLSVSSKSQAEGVRFGVNVTEEKIGDTWEALNEPRSVFGTVWVTKKNGTAHERGHEALKAALTDVWDGDYAYFSSKPSVAPVISCRVKPSVNQDGTDGVNISDVWHRDGDAPATGGDPVQVSRLNAMFGADNAPF